MSDRRRPRAHRAAFAPALLVLALALATLLAAEARPAPGAAAPDAFGLAQPDDPFHPDHPFPTARHLDPATGRLRVPAWALDPGLPPGAAGERARAVFAALRPGLSELDGAGLTARVRLRCSGPAPDADRLAARVRVLALDGSDGPAVRVEVDDGRVFIDPIGAWEPGACYVVLALAADAADGDAGGRSARRAPIVDRLLAAAPLDDPALERERRRVRAAVRGAAIAPSRVRVAFSLPIRTIEPELRRLQRTLAARASTRPRLTVTRDVPGPEVEGLPGETAVARVVYGTYESPDLRGEDGRFVPARVAGAVAPPATRVPFALALPATPRAAPCPVVMGMHGLGSDIDRTLPRHADWLARGGFAYLTIDGVGHGRRQRGALGAHLTLLDFDDPRRSRDALRQTLVDLATLRQLVGAGLSIDGGATSAVARRDPVWSGGSYGGIFGLMLAAFDPGLRAAHVEGCGGPWRDIIGESVAADMFGTWFSIKTGLPPRTPATERAVARWLELSQWIVDPGDPTALAPFLLRRRPTGTRRPRVLMQTWEGDGVMATPASDRLARIAGLPAGRVDDAGDGARARIAWRAPRWGIRAGEDAHAAFWRVPEARRQALAFLASGGARIGPPSPGPAY